MKRHVIFAALTLIVFQSWGQNRFEASYLEGKRLFANEEYGLAMEAFKPAMERLSSNPYQAYASYYYAVAAYRLGSRQLARNMFLQIKDSHPDWDYEEQIDFWIAYSYFEERNFVGAIGYAERISSEELVRKLNDLKYDSFSQVDSLSDLEQLLYRYPQDSILGTVIIDRVLSKPFEEWDHELLRFISEQQGLDIALGRVPSEVVRKDTYRVAVMFPFIYRNMEASGLYLRKSLVVELYEGIRMGVAQLEKQGIDIELFAYDTRGDTAHTRQLLESQEMLQMDLIIGPLVPGPSKIVQEFSLRNKVNMINPVSHNASIIGNNPFSFLLNPSTQTIGRFGGDFAVENLDNKNTLIYYGIRDTDSEMARAYREVVEADSFQVLSQRMVFRDSTEWLFEYLTRRQPMVDSLGVEVKDEAGKIMEELVIAPDSIGSIFLATFDFKIASEVLSAVADRGDSIQVIGHGDWLLDKTANYPSLQDLGIWLLAPKYIDLTNPTYLAFEETYIETHRTIPSEFASAGYECMLLVGYCLDRFGKYFQNGFRDQRISETGIYPGYDYRSANDNHFIPVLKFEDLELHVQNGEELRAQGSN